MPDLPATMRAVLLTGHGGPEMLEYREDVPVPVPAPGEVLVRVTACGVNNTDVWVREGAYGTDDDPGEVSSWRRGQPLKFPLIQGADVVGRIAAVGEDVDGGIIGKRVMVDFGIYNDAGASLANVDYIGHGRNGGFAEYCAVPRKTRTSSGRRFPTRSLRRSAVRTSPRSGCSTAPVSPAVRSCSSPAHRAA